MWKALAERTSCAAGTPVGSKATQPVPPRVVPTNMGEWRESYFWEYGYDSATHKTSCKCVCDAINSYREIGLYQRTDEGGHVSGLLYSYVYVGPPRTNGYVGRGSSCPPIPGHVPAPSWIILGHELCGHAVPMMGHPSDPTIRYNEKDPVIQIENQIRKEHSCPKTCTHPGRVDWGERGTFLP